MSTKQPKYKVGQTVHGANGSRTVTAVRGNTVSWRSKTGTGKCKAKSLQSWTYKRN